MTNSATAIKCLQIQRTSLLPELQELVKSFAFRDTKFYEIHHKIRMRAILQTIHESSSRKNGFNDPEDVENTVVEHWMFAPQTYDFQLQAINCRMCGNYLMTSTYQLFYAMSECSVCNCDRLMIGDDEHEYEEEEAEEQDYDW